RDRQEVQPARDDRHRFPGLPEEDDGREVRGVHLFARGGGGVPPRQLRDGPQGAQELEPEALRARVRDSRTGPPRSEEGARLARGGEGRPMMTTRASNARPRTHSMRKTAMGGVSLGALLLVSIVAQAQTDPLPSWNEGPAKKAIVDFVQATTDKGSP